MKTRILGKGLAASPVSLGCMGMTHAYRAADIALTAAEVAAIDEKLSQLDMSPMYGVRK